MVGVTLTYLRLKAVSLMGNYSYRCIFTKFHSKVQVAYRLSPTVELKNLHGENGDFFGIEEFENSIEVDRNIIIETNNNSKEIPKSECNSRDKEKVISTGFGVIRRDRDNIVLSRRQLRKIKFGERMNSESTHNNHTFRELDEIETSGDGKTHENDVNNKISMANYFDDMMLDDYTKRKTNYDKSLLNKDNPMCDIVAHENYSINDMNYIDNQFFSRNQQQGTDEDQDFQSKSKKYTEERTNDMNFVDEQYFGNNGMKYNFTALNQDVELSADEVQDENRRGTDLSQHPVPNNDSDIRKQLRQAFVTAAAPTNVSKIPARSSRLKQTEERRHSVFVEKHEARVDPAQADVEEPKTAFDLVMKIRAEKASIKSVNDTKDVVYAPGKGEKTDSKGYRIMRSHMTDFTRLPRSEIVDILRDSIIYDQDDIVAINKPYGLPSHGGPGVDASVGQLLADLSHRIDLSGQTQLHLVHRLDKETTGVMVLARTAEMASLLKSSFLSKDVIKIYWVITKDVPSPAQGIIDIPMRERKVGASYRMTVQPVSSPDATKSGVRKGSRFAASAITKYTVLDSSNCAALVQCQPQTGKKHQIRVHMSSGLNTPILGDHKYSHFTKLAPQRLSPEMLKSLGVRQTKVRDIPMHLHAQTVIFPQIVDGRNVKISVKPPRYFLKNLERLKLKNPFSRR